MNEKLANACAPKDDCAGQMVGCGSRQTAKGMLHDKIARLRHEADMLEALAGALPEKLPLQADAALWDLLIRR